MKPVVFSGISCALLFATFPAAAYVGPGLGLSAIGTGLALLAAVLLAVAGFVWYPVKRFLLNKKNRTNAQPVAESKDDNET